MAKGESNAKLWWPWRFSLRFLLLVMFGVAAFSAGWAANDWNRRRMIEVPLRIPPPPAFDGITLAPVEVRPMAVPPDETKGRPSR